MFLLFYTCKRSSECLLWQTNTNQMLFQRFAWDLFWRMLITQLCTLEPDQINKAQRCLFWQPKASNNLERIPLYMITKIITINPPKVKLTHYLFTRMHSSDLDHRHFTWVQVVTSIFVAFNWVITHLLKLKNQVLQETSANKSTSDISLGMKRDHLQMHFSSELVKICSRLCKVLGFA